MVKLKENVELIAIIKCLKVVVLLVMPIKMKSSPYSNATVHESLSLICWNGYRCE